MRASTSGSDDAGEIEAARIEGDRVGQVGAPDEVDHHRLPCRNLDRRDEAAAERENEQPADRHPVRRGEEPERGRLDEERDLRGAHDAELVRPVHDGPGGHREEQDGNGGHRRDEADEERAVGQLQREPSLGHRLHPRADQRQRLADQEQAEVPVPQDDAKRIERGRRGHARNIER
jgi:hypothetical protein